MCLYAVHTQATPVNFTSYLQTEQINGLYAEQPNKRKKRRRKKTDSPYEYIYKALNHAIVNTSLFLSPTQDAAASTATALCLW